MHGDSRLRLGGSPHTQVQRMGRAGARTLSVSSHLTNPNASPNDGQSALVSPGLSPRDSGPHWAPRSGATSTPSLGPVILSSPRGCGRHSESLQGHLVPGPVLVFVAFVLGGGGALLVNWVASLAEFGAEGGHSPHTRASVFLEGALPLLPQGQAMIWTSLCSKRGTLGSGS